MSFGIKSFGTFPFGATFYEIAETPRLLKYWNGSAWVEKPLKRWNGSSWVSTGVLKYYNGSTWL